MRERVGMGGNKMNTLVAKGFSPLQPWLQRGAAMDDDEEGVELSGCCAQECSGLGHSCMVYRFVASHYKPLHSYLICESVVMPVNGYYFCNFKCLRRYNVHLAGLGADTIMPEDGPGNDSEDRFLLPVRRRPEAAIEAIDVSDEDPDAELVPKEGGKAKGAEDDEDSNSDEVEIQEEGKDNADEEPSAVEVGSRIRMCFNRPPPAWFGGLVVWLDELLRFWIAFDDGDLRVIPKFKLLADLKVGSAAATMDVAEGGLVADVGGGARAEDVTWHNGKPVGVLLGNTGLKMGGMLIYQSHVVQPASFTAPLRNRGSRSAGAGTTVSIREYGGWHTFFKGDRVEYAAGQKAGQKGAQVQVASAIVFGFAWHKGGSAAQGRKFLILYEEGSQIFFLGMCTKWRRRRGDGIKDGDYDTKFDEDCHDQAATISVELCERMNQDFEVSGALAILALDTFTKVESQSKHPPPILREQLKEEAKAAKAKAPPKVKPPRAPPTKPPPKQPQKPPKRKKVDDEDDDEDEDDDDEEEEEEEEEARVLKAPKAPKAPKNKAADKAATADKAAAALPLPKQPLQVPPKKRKPADVKDEEKKDVEDEVKDEMEPKPPKPPSKLKAAAAVPRLLRGWKSSYDEDGVIFYYNKDRTKVQYEEPPASPLPQEPSPPPKPPPKPKAAAAVPRLPRGWKSSFDEDGVIFYYNKDRTKVQYEEPPASPLPQEPSPRPPPPPPMAPLQRQRPPQPPTPARLPTPPLGGSSSSTSGIQPVHPQQHLKPMEQQRLRQMAALRSQLVYATSEENKMRIAGLLAELEFVQEQGWT